MSTELIYNPNIPEKRDDSLSDTQPEMLTNFQVIFNSFMRNHVSLDAVSNAGTHNVTELIQLLGDPQTNASELSIYTKDVKGQTDQLFIRYQNETTFQFTNYQLYTLVNPVGQISYFTFLPGKVIVYFGVVTRFTTPAYVIDLSPQICKNIITCSFGLLGVPSGVPKNYKPYVSFEKNSDGFYSKATATYSSAFTTSFETNYLIMGSI